MSAADVRRAFLDYFAAAGHTVVASSSLVPGNDPTLLFTNAGMVQFKDVFLGQDQRPYVRATSSQRCVRAGGKHNDLENVGYTARHHTFFEMLGNFSFGDYFKADAIKHAWTFLTGTLGIDPARLWVTVYQDDDEAADIWIKQVGVPANRLTRLGEKSNFWSMGDTGPCGPCTEIFFDHGAHIPGGPPGSPDEDGDRYVEVWNLVFMQYDRSADGTMTPLPKPSVDTGMGLERISAVMQGVHTNYDIDLFQGLIAAAATLVRTTDLASPSLRVIADHIRACAFLVADGVLPSNEGRGYVLRRIMRRAMRHGHKFGAEPTFFAELLPALVSAMGQAYPELIERQSFIRDVLFKEGEQFARTLANGMGLLDTAIAALGTGTLLGGDTAFKLYDTYGFPADLTADICRERGLSLDQAGFDAAMETQRDRARAASRFGVDLRGGADLGTVTTFEGYEHLATTSKVVALLKDGVTVSQLQAGEQGEVVLDHTPFYAESGGQVGDTGLLQAAGVSFAVADTRKRGTAFTHIGQLHSGSLQVGDALDAQVDGARRAHIRRNHSATHLLHAALREQLGTHVTQKGSLVTSERLRFDFAHHQPVTADELRAIEQRVNEQVRANAPAHTQVMPYDQAVAAGAMALFGEKYADEVRVLQLGSFSVELCGGTHVERAGDIGLFKIVSEGGVAAGVRRIEAVSGQGAIDHISQTDDILRSVAALVRGTRDDVSARVHDSLEQLRSLEKQVRSLKDKLASGAGTDLAAAAVDVAGTKVLATVIDGADATALRAAVDQLKDRFKSAVIVLASVAGPDKVVLVAGVTADLVGKVKAGEVVGAVAAQVGGKGGGRPDFAQAGGTLPAALPAALASVADFVRTKLGG
ncbi:MAG: alanine--tRNA ligase [Proteobacteria bacterium]|nr:alanine--tRNA ligase [Pseudomonadota bacterium]